MQLRVAGVIAYPFSRGLRVEFTGGVRHATYHRDLRSQISSAETGKVLATDRVESPRRVADDSSGGERGAGARHDRLRPDGAAARIAVSIRDRAGRRPAVVYERDGRFPQVPDAGPSVLDRRARAAFGRYGADGSDPRLLSNFLGSSYFVRGHRQDLRYCRPDATRVCGDDLLGSRLLVGNVEVRVPLWGIRSRQLDYGMFPADAFVFADGGRIWSGPTEPGSRMISSFGGGIRINAAGFPLELAAIRALDGPRPRWQFDLGFRVGF